MTAAVSDYKLGTCKWCGEKGEVFRDSLYCDDCDSNVCRCSVCKQSYHYENTCRHIFQDQEFEWRGAGVNPTDEEMRLPFHRLLSAMGEEFTTDLKAAIKSGKFYTWMMAPMIGGGGSLSLNGMPQRDGRWMVSAWGDVLIKIGESVKAEEFHDGYRWLVSLYKTNTTKANRTTLAWIDRWLWPLTP
jgi:hypothetical protein